MCIAIVKNKGQFIPTEEELRKCFSTNKDGAGIAWMEDGVCKWVKGLMNIDDFLKKLNEIPDLKETIAMFHFRIATHGDDSVKQGLTHPFPVTADREAQIAHEGTSRMIAMHNGVLYKYGSMAVADPDSKYSDTVNFIGKFLSPMMEPEKAFLDPEVGKKIETELVGYNKLAIMGDGEVKTFGTGWIEHNGNLFSNAGFRPYSTSKASDPRGWGNSNTGVNGNYSGNYTSKYTRTSSLREEWRTSLRPLEADETFLSSNGRDTPIQFIGSDFDGMLLVDDFDRVFQCFPTKKKKANWMHVGYLTTSDDARWSYYQAMAEYD